MKKYDKLGYTRKWVDSGLLEEEILDKQLERFNLGVDNNTEHYRYATFLNWLGKKERFSDEEVANYITLAIEDEVQMMGGSAVKALFESGKLSDDQYEYVKKRLPVFGKWTNKLISRHDLKKEIQNGEFSKDLIERCWKYKEVYRDNSIIHLLLEKMEDSDLMKEFERFNASKKLKTRIQQKLNR